MRVAICFFGLTRNLKPLTLNMLELNIYNSLKKNNIDYITFLHTYSLKSITNPRSKEYNVELIKDDWKKLNPNYYLIECQDIFDNQFDWQSIYKYGDAWNDNFISLQNLIRQLNSLKKVTQLMAKYKSNITNNSINEFDAVIYLRPDQLYYTPLDINNLLDIINKKDDKIILTAKWAAYTGFNDRFYITNFKTALIVGNRFDNIIEYCETNKDKTSIWTDNGITIANTVPLYAEGLLKWISDKNNIKNIFTNMGAIRMRANNTYVWCKGMPKIPDSIKKSLDKEQIKLFSR